MFLELKSLLSCFLIGGFECNYPAYIVEVCFERSQIATPFKLNELFTFCPNSEQSVMRQWMIALEWEFIMKILVI
jgi:hypothetical protein